MTSSFFFYDLETSGLKPSEARIMQFAGQRTDMDLKPIGDPVNLHIKLTPDVLPDPDAVLLTGITPQQTIESGITESEFLKLFYNEIALPNTIFVGFNSVRFDDEFLRFTNYRNFYDAYEWQWKDGRSRWDILDLVRMTRALRPDGIVWPFNADNKPVNRLELLTKSNSLAHDSAHDALSDVNATIAVAKLVKDKQPDLFSYLLKMRDKKQVAALLDKNEPLVYTSSHYPSEILHTTVVARVASHPKSEAALVYDLRHDPGTFIAMTATELAEAWQYSTDPDHVRLPVKTLKYNRVPAIAPLGVIKDKTVQSRLGFKLEDITDNLNILKKHQAEFAKKLEQAIDILDKTQEDRRLSLKLDVDASLYDGFMPNADRNLLPEIRSADPAELVGFRLKLHDKRLKELLFLYQARNFPESLNGSEQKAWRQYRSKQLTSGAQSSRHSKYLERLDELEKRALNQQQHAVIESLKLYAETLIA